MSQTVNSGSYLTRCLQLLSWAAAPGSMMMVGINAGRTSKHAELRQMCRTVHDNNEGGRGHFDNAMLIEPSTGLGIRSLTWMEVSLQISLLPSASDAVQDTTLVIVASKRSVAD